MNDPALGPDVILALIPSDLNRLVKRLEPRGMIRRDLDLFSLYLPADGSRGVPALSGPFLGAPQAVMALEKIIALGAVRIWVLGWCGSLQPDLCIGDLVIPTGSLIEEGTSGHYPIGEGRHRTDPALNAVLEDGLRKWGESCRRGTVWTTDAPYRETPSKVRAYRERGILAVEMEMSALMTVAVFRGVKLTGLLVVSDELSELKWRHGFSDPRLKRASRLAGEVLIEAVDSLGDEAPG